MMRHIENICCHQYHETVYLTCKYNVCVCVRVRVRVRVLVRELSSVSYQVRYIIKVNIATHKNIIF